MYYYFGIQRHRRFVLQYNLNSSVGDVDETRFSGGRVFPRERGQPLGRIVRFRRHQCQAGGGAARCLVHHLPRSYQGTQIIGEGEGSRYVGGGRGTCFQ